MKRMDPHPGDNWPIPFVVMALILFCTHAHAETGKASWYSFDSCRREGTSGYYTASGEPFLEEAMTCALPHRKFDGLYRVTNIENGKSVVVRHNDKGPGKKPRSRGVIVDLSKGAFRKIANLKQGIARVKVEVIK